jgi:hypothetical protein
MIDYQMQSTAVIAAVLIETKTTLDHWSKQLHRTHYFEFGTDAKLVASIEEDLQHVVKRIRQIKPRYSIASSSFRDANNYCEMVEQLNATLEFIRGVRVQNYGSMQNTETCLLHLERCLIKVRQVSHTVHYVSAGFH